MPGSWKCSCVWPFAARLAAQTDYCEQLPPGYREILDPPINHRRIAHRADRFLQQFFNRLVGPRADQFPGDLPQQGFGVARKRLMNAARPGVGIGN